MQHVESLAGMQISVKWAPRSLRSAVVALSRYYTIQKESISSFAFVGGIQMFKKVLTGGLITFKDESSEIIGQLKTKIQDKGQMVEE